MVCPPSPQTINSCTGTFYDGGGSGANYPNNQNCVYTFCSNSPGECLMLNFTMFNVSDFDFFGNPYDYMAVFEGPSTASPLLYYIYGGPFPAPFPVASSGTCLTFQFISDGSVRTAGWAATLNCQPCPIPTSPTQQDCNGAIPICQEQYYQPFSYSGNNGSNILPASCCVFPEQNNSWYVFTAQTSGPLSFIISPNYTADDYDFALFDISNGGCPGITTGASPQVSCNYAADVATWAGQTGAFSGAPYFGTLNNQGAAGTAFNASPPVVAGNTYALVINNFSSSQGGYYLDLTQSAASLFDNVVPVMDAISPVACGATTITINFSEPILCSTLQAADFTVTGGPPITVTGVTGSGCGGAGTFTQSVTLTVNPALSSGGPYSVNIVGTISDLCSNNATGSQSFSLSATATAGSDVSVCGLSATLNGNNPSPGTGLWTQVSSSSGGTTIFSNATSPTSTATASLPGVYVYQWTVTVGACIVNDQVTITFTAPSNAGSNGSITLCSNGAPVNLFASLGGSPQTSGTWTGPSALGGGNLGTFTPGVSNAGIYTYTITGTAPCTNASATVTVTVNTATNAGSNGSIVLCSSGVPVNLFSSLGGTPQATGSWSGPSVLGGGNLGTFTPGISTAGVYTYTVTGTSPCVNSTATVNVTVNPAPNAGSNGTITLCSTGTPVNLFSLLGGAPQATGTWSGPSALGGGNLGTFDPSIHIAGIYTYTVTGTAPCVNAGATVTVTVTPAPSSVINYPGAPFCTNYIGNVSPVITGTAGGTFSSIPVGLSINSSTGVITPSSSTPGTYTVTYLIAASGNCPSYSVSQSIVISQLPPNPLLSPANPCSGTVINFTASGGTFYEFLVNGTSQGPPSASGNISLGPLNAGDQVCVNNYPAIPFNFDGNIIEPEWGTALANSNGGPPASGFGAGNNLDGLFLKNGSGYLFGAIASNLVNNSNNRILLFIDCLPGGFNNLGAWVARNNAPYYSIENLSNGITFDPGFTADFVLGVNQATANSYFDLYNMTGNVNNYLGDGNTSNILGFTGNAGTGDYTKGFEFAIPLSAIGSPSGSIKVFAMMVNDPGFGVPTGLSNQFLTHCNPAELNYGNGAVDFSLAVPDPVSYLMSADCFAQTCVTVVNSVNPLFSFITSYCTGDTPAILPPISDNGITGTWSPAVISTASAGIVAYTFTPDAGQCATPIIVNITINNTPAVTPVFHD